MKTMINLKGLSAALVASMLIAGPTFADSAALKEHREQLDMNATAFEEHMQMVKDETVASKMSQVDALQLQVNELQELVFKIIEHIRSNE
ncbi:hypothetical protein ACGTNG_10290 [Halomonas sp. 1390]|uniref:hypothetical protein n=1 Tax=Halomonas sp. B23F22_3 TaxID=3459516 RepID=UPI00373FBE25